MNISLALASDPPIDFARRVFEANELPWHRAVKKVPYFDLESESLKL